MGGSGRQRDTSTHGRARSLIDQGVVPEDFHATDGADEAGGDIGSHLHRRGDGAVVVGGGDSNTAGAGERGGQVIGGGMPTLEKGNTSGGEDEENAEEDILDETALGAGNSRRVHRANTHKYDPVFLAEMAGF